MLRVGTFLPPAADCGGTAERHPHPHPHATRSAVGKIPRDDHALLMMLLRDLTDVEFLHDLDIRRSWVRNGKVYCGEVCLNDLDLYLWHADLSRDPGDYAMEALGTLSLDTPVVPDPARFWTGLDKYRAHLRLARAGLPVPDTVLVDHRDTAAVAPVVAEWGRALLKPRRESFGHGVLLIEDYATLRDLSDYLTGTLAATTESTFLLERYYPNSPADWVGTTLVNGTLMYGYRKRGHRFTAMSPDTWKVYDPDRIGGDVDGCEVPPAHARLVRRAQRVLGLPLIGFDVILCEGRPVIVDENTFPGLYPDLFAAAGRSLGHELFALVRDSIRRLARPRQQLTEPHHDRAPIRTDPA